ncbi:MAG: hypothetical protein JWQ63_3374 [Mucilaginibacter sp.]|nr:hypothetical protein [Mucilaginibacter sp.]
MSHLNYNIMKKILAIAAIFMFSFQTLAFCQSDNSVSANAVSKLKALINDHIIEKAYLQFDRPYAYYVAGEIVYFKAYVTMGERHEPSGLSGILHVDLIGKNDVSMQSISLLLNNGTAWGDFKLPDTLQKGSYRIRAYTEWMRNEKNPNFFEQYISVSSLNNVNRMAEAVKQSAQPNLQFFPEGGNLITDIRSKIAFKAIGTDGLGINVKGIVIDNDKKEVAKITSAHLGMGMFDFIPEEGKSYKAKVVFADGTQSTVDLPAVESKGITLSVNNDDPNKVSIEIKANRAYYKENISKELNLLIYWAGSIRTVTTKLDNEVLGLDLPSNIFRTGILQVTLLSQTGEPLSERLAFIQNQDLLNLNITSNKQAYNKRENVQLNFNAKNKDGNAVNGSFSVSVIDESKILVDENAENTILSYLLLTSDLKGHIEKPNYYFADVTKDTRKDLDALMLTQGFRRFVWKELLNDNTNTAATFNPEKSIDISGELKTKSGIPIGNCKITLIAADGGPVLTGETDTQGKFRFSNVVFLSDTRFILKTQSSSGKNAVLTFDNPAVGPAITPGSSIISKYNANADILASLQNNQQPGVLTASNGSKNIYLKNDKVIGPKRSYSYRSSNLGGPGHADQVILGDQIANSPTISAAINGLAHGLLFNSGVPSLATGMTISGQGGGTQGLVPMLVIVDGTNMGRGVNIDNFNPGSVEAVEILKGANAAIYGVEGGQGVMVITTRQGVLNDQIVSKEMSPGIFSFEPKGFYKAREFYSPRYEANQPSGNLPDQRTTIFWKPDVSTDADGNASFNFFNADGTGTYRVEIEGFDTKGNLGRQVYRYKVQ